MLFKVKNVRVPRIGAQKRGESNQGERKIKSAFPDDLDIKKNNVTTATAKYSSIE